MGTNIIIYCPEFNDTVDDSSLYVRILYRFFENVYGIHIGTSDFDLFNSNPLIYPLHAANMYSMGLMDPYSFLLIFGDLNISNDLYIKLIEDINPYGETYDDKCAYIKLIRKSLSKNNKVKCALLNI